MACRCVIIVLLLLALSQVMHPICKNIRSQANRQIEPDETFSVMSNLSRMNKKHSARCLPVCLPGIWRKPTRSDLSCMFFCRPVMVFTSTPSIQWAVTAMNETRFGSDQASVVKEILPRDFCQHVEQKKAIKNIFDLHFLP